MDKTLYKKIIDILPSRIIVNVGNEFIKIAVAADSDSLTLGHHLICCIMNVDDYQEKVFHWAHQNSRFSLLYSQDYDQSKYDKLIKAAFSLQEKLELERVYYGGILPYQCEEILDDGSILLSRVDSFEEFERLNGL